MAHDPSSLPVATQIDVDEARGVTLRPNRRPEKPLWRAVLEPLASLKLTVVLLALSIILVFVGTFAQWRVETHEAAKRYFRVWFARVELGDLTPKNFFPDTYRVTEAWESAHRFHEQGNLTNWLSRDITRKPAAEKIEEGKTPGFYIPGGIPLGILMTLNLLAAHGLKFKIQARGQRVWWGLGTIIAGGLMVWGVVHKQQGEITSGISSDTQSYLWNGIAVGLAALWALSGYALLTYAPEKKQQRIYTAIGGLVALAAFVFVMYRISNETPLLDPNNTRILWQLIQAEFAAVTLLVGCYLLFFKRAGVVLLHGGILLLMFNELLVYKTHVEWQMDIAEKRSNWHARDIRHLELAIERDSVVEPKATKVSIGADATPRVHEREVISIPWERLWDESAKIPTGRLEDPTLPFDLEVVRFFKNTKNESRNLRPGEKPLATKGRGLKTAVEEQRPNTTEAVDIPVAWVKIFPKGKKEPLGIYMLHSWNGTNDEPEIIAIPQAEGQDETYNVSLRYERAYMPYTIDLREVRKDDYLGSNTPRNYSSDITLNESKSGAKHEHHIRMNEPLRFKGQTMYQSSYNENGGPELLQDSKSKDWRLYDPNVEDDSKREKEIYKAKVTTLQIVSNTGWMLPYMCCMIVLTGMAYHFMSVAARYFSRYGREAVNPLWASLFPKLWLRQQAAAQPAEPANAGEKKRKPSKTKLRDATQFEVTTSQFDVHQEYRSPWPFVMTAVFLLAFVGYTTYRAWPPKPFVTETSDPKNPDKKEIQVVDNAPDLRGFGELPAVFKGRVKPLDTLARNSLSLISRQESFVDRHGKRQPAIKWLLDLWADFENFKYHRIFYIENPELLENLGLPRRQTHLYSYAELEYEDVQRKLHNLVQAARSKDPLKLDILDKRAVELGVRWQVPQEMLISFKKPELEQLKYAPRSNSFEDIKEARIMARVAHVQILERMEEITSKLPLLIPIPARSQLKENLVQEAKDYYRLGKDEILEAATKRNLPQLLEMIPDRDPEKIWSHSVQPVAVAIFMEQYPMINHPWSTYATRLADSAALAINFQRPETYLNPYLAIFQQLLHDYYQRDYGQFNQLLPEYRKLVMAEFDGITDSTDQKYGSEYKKKYSAAKVPFESWYNAWNPFAIAMPFYLVAFVLALAGMIFAPRVLQPATYWLLWAIFIVHTLALGMRIYLSGHPPVTNLYSSALFIGWGMVLLALLLEGYSRRGFGSIAAGLGGFFTLWISTSLYAETKDWSSTGGDTMGVMQAVLDTDFWLATHVVTVALGYATTVLAGVFGAIYLKANAAAYLDARAGGNPIASINVATEKDLNRAIYGTICFAIIFSFVGTVLGGLWADDSWGRFWGWDPKENGALIIVLWNALVLHARWDGMIKERGLAVLSLAGGIVTGWSWFGVNELGVGLHSYGFKDGMLLKLMLFAGGSILVMFLGFLPRSAIPVAEVTVDEAKMS